MKLPPAGTVLGRVHAQVDTSANPFLGRQFIAELTNLTPNQIHCYEVLSGGQTIVGRTGFRTAPTSGPGSVVRFSTLGDLGKNSAEQRLVLKAMQTVRSDFVLINGDAAYEVGSALEIETNFFGVYRDMIGKVPFFLATGNHDYKTRDAAPFREAFALFENGEEDGVERWYSFDWGPLHVVVLDTQKIGERQATWLDQDLAKNQLPWVVVTGHKPAYSSGHHGSNSSVRKHFVPVFEKHQVPLVIAGHDHNYERTKTINGVTYLVTGAGGRGTRPVGSSDFTGFALQVSHFTHVTVEADVMTLRAIDATGGLFDTAVIRKTVSPRAGADANQNAR